MARCVNYCGVWFFDINAYLGLGGRDLSKFFRVKPTGGGVYNILIKPLLYALAASLVIVVVLFKQLPPLLYNEVEYVVYMVRKVFIIPYFLMAYFYRILIRRTKNGYLLIPGSILISFTCFFFLAAHMWMRGVRLLD